MVNTDIAPELKLIAEKVKTGQRITDEEGLFLFEKASLGFVGSLANEVRIRKNGDKVYFCLLYTSPSPRDRTRSRMPSSA